MTFREPREAVAKPTAAPKHLSREAKTLWRSVVSEYLLEAHHLSVLERACEQLDRLRQAEAAIAEHGLLVEGRFGLKPNPAVGMARDATTLYLRSLKEVGLDLEIPRSGSERTAAARAARWAQ